MHNDNEVKKYDYSRGCVVERNDEGELLAEYRQGCCKLEVYNWLEGINQEQYKDIFEVRFKNVRKAIYVNKSGQTIKIGDKVVVFKYVDDILLGVCNSCFNIDMFSEHHESIESKLSELKNIIIKYYPTPTTNNLSSALFDIFRCEKDLRFHSNIEDYLLIPAIKLIENSKTV